MLVWSWTWNRLKCIVGFQSLGARANFWVTLVCVGVASAIVVDTDCKRAWSLQHHYVERMWARGVVISWGSTAHCVDWCYWFACLLLSVFEAFLVFQVFCTKRRQLKHICLMMICFVYCSVDRGSLWVPQQVGGGNIHNKEIWWALTELRHTAIWLAIA